MKNENDIEVRHLGLTIKVTRENDSRFIIPDYTTGKRFRHVRTSEAAAKEKAKSASESAGACCGRRRWRVWRRSHTRDQPVGLDATKSGAANGFHRNERRSDEDRWVTLRAGIGQSESVVARVPQRIRADIPATLVGENPETSRSFERAWPVHPEKKR